MPNSDSESEGPVEVPLHFKCPISMSMFIDPINVPCCGRAYSRGSLQVIFANRKACPICQEELPNFDVTAAPKAISLQDTLDAFIKDHDGNIEDLVPDKSSIILPKWKITLHRVKQRGANLTKIGQLRITNTNNKFKFKTLLMIAVDESGSMGGNPINQVKFSLKRIVDSAYDNPSVLCQVIGYDNTAQSFFIDTQQSKETNYARVDKIGRMGGTTFQSAFTKIVQIMNNMKISPIHNLNEISNLVVVFMTDGQDCTSGDARMNMVAKLSLDIKSVWDKQFLVHTIGFGQGHDFDFLQRLSRAGTQDGAYRFADPMEDNDSLSVKINSIIRTVMDGASSSPPVVLIPYSPGDQDIEKLDLIAPKLIAESGGTYWVDVTRHDEDDDEDAEYMYTVRMKGIPDQIVKINFESSGFHGDDLDNEKEKQKIEYAWYSYLIDRIAEELFELNTKVPYQSQTDKNTVQLDRQIHLEILNQRIKALTLRLDTSSDESRRLCGLTDTLNSLRKGEIVDQKKLADQKAEGQYKTIGQGKPPVPYTGPQAVPLYTPSNYVTQQPSIVNSWDVIDTSIIKRIMIQGLDLEVQQIIKMFVNEKYVVCKEWLDRASDQTIIRIIDGQGSDLLIMMCSTGRVKIVQDLISKGIFNLSNRNKNGHTALDCATMFGFWKSYDILRSVHKDEIKTDRYLAFRTCIGKPAPHTFYHMASRLVKEKAVVIDDDMINSCPGHATQWLISHSSLDIDMDTAVIKGVYDIVEEKIQKGFKDKLDWRIFHKIVNISKVKIEHVQIFELLLRNALLDPDQTYEIQNPTIDKKEGDDDTEITWPLFVASEKGDQNMFNLLIKYCSKESINRQNKKGSYCLWIASCNKHIDIVSRLLTEGADPNMINVKGENCIVPACQKSLSVVEILLVAGARIDLYDKTRDNPILLCCRNDQYQILETFLQRMNAQELEHIHDQYADIDGLNPLHAAVEQNRVNCVRVLVRYRANIEWKTKLDNQIIAGATALHLACFYDMLEAFKVLQELGADLYSTTDVGGYNCMHIAVRRGHMRIVGYLMSLGSETRDHLLTQKDSEGRVPGYYAQISGNEEIYQEYFCNRLIQYMEKLVYAPDDVMQACSDKLVRYGQSLGVYEYKDLTNVDMGRGMSLATLGTLNRSYILMDSLIKMNTDMNQKDEYGVSANFWRALVNSSDDTSNRVFNPEIELMLGRLESVRSKSVQNKVLLASPNKAPLLLDNNTNQLINVNTDPMTPLLKMNDGYNQKVDQSVLKLLKRSGFMEQSLLGFMDKLKSGKNFPDGKDCLEYIMWDSRIHMIKLVATDERYLNPVQILALYLYTTNKTIFEQVNLTLTKWNNTNVTMWHPFILTLYQAVLAIPSFDGEVYRTINHKFDPDFYKIGSELMWSTFSVCSKEYSSCVDAIKQNTGIVFIVKSKTGREIGRYSKTPVDQDVMFLPESKFVVTNYYQANQIALAQANIRNKTFKIREKDIENATMGCCIIIEIQEI